MSKVIDRTCSVCKKEIDEIGGRRILFEHTPDLLTWICQKCRGRWCEKCDTPHQFPMGLDYITDKGEILHSPILPIGKACRSPDCK